MKLPPALLVGGTDGHRRRVFVRDFIAKCIASGYIQQPLDGADRAGLQSLVSTVGVLFPNPTLVVITRPEKITAADLGGHLQSPNPDLVLLLVSEVDKPSGGILDGFPAAQTKLFTLPAFYKLDEHAAGYARELSKAKGVDLPDGLARAMVKLAGNDLGVISFEVDKAVRLATALGVKVLEPAHLRGTVASLTEQDGSAVLDALGTRRARVISDELARYKASKKGDPTIELCGKSLTPTVLRWLQAAYLQSTGTAPASAASRVGSNPWYWENKVLPHARNWGVDGCRGLLGAVSSAQKSVFDGALNPWGLLESSILRLSK